MITYNSAISSCERSGQWQVALLLFQSLRQKQLEATNVTCSVITRPGPSWAKRLVVGLFRCTGGFYHYQKMKHQDGASKMSSQKWVFEWQDFEVWPIAHDTKLAGFVIEISDTCVCSQSRENAV